MAGRNAQHLVALRARPASAVRRGSGLYRRHDSRRLGQHRHHQSRHPRGPTKPPPSGPVARPWRPPSAKSTADIRALVPTGAPSASPAGPLTAYGTPPNSRDGGTQCRSSILQPARVPEDRSAPRLSNTQPDQDNPIGRYRGRRPDPWWGGLSALMGTEAVENLGTPCETQATGKTAARVSAREIGDVSISAATAPPRPSTAPNPPRKVSVERFDAAIKAICGLRAGAPYRSATPVAARRRRADAPLAGGRVPRRPARSRERSSRRDDRLRSSR